MPATKWQPDTVNWLTEKRNELQGQNPTMPWVRNTLLPQFLERCGSDPQLKKPGFITKDDLTLVCLLMSYLGDSFNLILLSET